MSSSDNDYVLIGESLAIRRLRDEIECAARADAKVLITGESGVGKEVVFRQLHRLSRRSRGPLVLVNCGGMTESLLESGLFGHVRGSFTGAYRDKPGKLEQAAAGTLFLDEVGEMGPRMQALLLRFLETGEIQPVGSDRSNTRVDVRVVSATNRNLIEGVKSQAFREDLYYRLNVMHITVPPLREHREDVPLLVDHFLGVFSRTYGIVRPELSLESIGRLQQHDWPGNVRELKHLMERLIVRWNAANPVAADLLFDSVLARPTPPPKPAPASRAAGLHQRMVQGRESFWTVVHKPFLDHDLTRADLQQLIEIGLSETQGSYRILVDLYNVDRTQYKRFMSFLRSHGCHVPFQAFRKTPLKTGLKPHPDADPGQVPGRPAARNVAQLPDQRTESTKARQAG